MAAGCHPEPVTPSDDLSPPRRPIFFPVVIATVFLTIIAMTAGYVLGERRRGEVNDARPDPGPVGQSSDAARRPAPSGAKCPEETLVTARELGFPDDLRQVLRIVTDNGTVVWICRDPDGDLYYQGKTGGENSALVQHDNGLFLPDVEKLSEDRYRATAKKDGARITISRDQLEVVKPGSGPQVNGVIQAE